MTYQSKYYNLQSHGPKWTAVEFAWVVKKLETSHRKSLLNICRDKLIALTFTGDDWNKITSDEQIISALITDYPPKLLMSVIKRYLGK